MKKKMGMICFVVILMLLMVPAISALDMQKDSKKHNSTTQNSQTKVGIGYLLVHVLAFTPGTGFHPYKGAVVTVKGFLYSYNGTTDENGDILFSVQTKLFRPKVYFVKASVMSNNRTVSRINTVMIHWQQIVYKDFLFLVR